MAKVLVVYASPTKIEVGHTAALVNRFLKYYKELNPNDSIEWLDLNTQEEITHHVLNANETKEFFDRSDKYIDQLKSVDKVILATPMNNFNVSAMLKVYLDYILVANKTFRYKYDAYKKFEGLLTNLKVQVLATQGAPRDWYPWGDMVKYLEGCCDFLGMHINRSILIGGTKTSLYKDKTLEQMLDDYDGEIRDVVKHF